jgi:hypothetical protein
MIDQSKIVSLQSGSIYYTLFWRCTTVLRLVPATPICTNLVLKNQFPELNRHIFTINFTVWSHILSTIGDALSNFTHHSSWAKTVHPICGPFSVIVQKTGVMPNFTVVILMSCLESAAVKRLLYPFRGSGSDNKSMPSVGPNVIKYI